MSSIALRATAAALATAALGVGGLVSATGAQAWDTAIWDKVAFCESTNRWAVNTGNGFYGGLQFTISTWNEFGGQQFASRADFATKSEQIAVARRVLAGQGPGAWPVCSRYAGLTKENGGADPNAMPVPDGYSSGTTPAPAPTPAPTPTPTPAPAPADPAKVIIEVDGVLGPLTVVEMQKWTGAQPDGIWGPMTSRALQAKVGAQVTGVRDEQTTYKVQKYVGATQDGIWGRQTTTYLQRFLNAR